MILRNRVAIVTGASRGIGLSIARAFSREGASVVLCARDGSLASREARALQQAGGRALGIECDVSRAEDVSELVATTLDTYGRIDILAANAAVFPPFEAVMDMPEDQWRKLLDINITGVMFCNRAVLPHMIRQNYGRIQNLGSGLEFAGMEKSAAYSASKGAVNAMTRVLAAEVSRYDIKVNVHYPGNLKTDMNPTGIGVPEDAVPCALYLASLPPDGPTGRTFQFDKEVVIRTEEVPRPE